MRRLSCLTLSLLLASCNTCYVSPPSSGTVTSSHVNHDVVEMDAIASPQPSISLVDPRARASANPISRRILIIGDSEACAVGLVAQEVVRELAKESNVPVDHVDVECKVGTVIQYWAGGHFQAALTAHPKPDTVLIFLGTNHYRQKSVPSSRVILEQITQQHLSCIWVGNVAVKGKTWPINRMLREAVSPPCDYFDAEAFPMKLGDGVHPDRANAKKWLKAIWAMIPLKYETPHE